MDFPVCPACGQSVIDDDVEDCPFCGSSMKAKPGSKPAAAKTAPAATAKPAAPKPSGSTVKSGATVKSGPGSKSAASSPTEDFPFEADLPGAKTAIQATPNPSKGRTLEVICPMCETSGYVPPTAVGKDVKCANTKCMVPIFKAPAPVAEAPPPPLPKKSNLVLVGGATIALMAILGVGAIVAPSLMTTGPKPIQKGQLSEEAKAMMQELALDSQKPANSEATGSAKSTPETKAETTKTIPTGPKSADELIAVALKQLNEVCLAGDKQRSKAFCRQLAADACFRAGDDAAANTHLEQLVNVGRSVAYYRIEPNLVRFWRDWAGNKASAKKALDAAVADAPKMQKVGRNHLEVASQLAAALVVAGQQKEALDLLEEHHSSELIGQLAAQTQIASDGRISRLTRTRSVMPWSRPQAVSTTSALAARGYLLEARKFAESQQDEGARVECLAFWSEELSKTKPKVEGIESLPEVAEAIKGLSPALAARVWARAACGRIAAGDQAGALATLKIAQNLIGSLPAPAEPEMPGIKQAIGYKLPASLPLIQAATAAAEMSFAYSLSPDQIPLAEESLELSLTFIRGLAPAWSAVSAKLDQADQLGGSGLRDLIKKELQLKSDDLASQNVTKYRKALSDFREQSESRRDLQAQILTRMVDAGLKNKVWSVVSNRSAESNASRRDDFLNSAVTGRLLEAFQGSETEKAIQGAVGESLPAWSDTGMVKALLRQQNLQEAGQYVSKLDSNSGHRDEVALIWATSLASTDQGDALGFISKLEDLVLKEEAYRLAAALMAQRGQTEAIMKHIGVVLQATEKASLYRGLVVGLKAGPPAKELPEPALMP